MKLFIYAQNSLLTLTIHKTVTYRGYRYIIIWGMTLFTICTISQLNWWNRICKKFTNIDTLFNIITSKQLLKCYNVRSYVIIFWYKYQMLLTVDIAFEMIITFTIFSLHKWNFIWSVKTQPSSFFNRLSMICCTKFSKYNTNLIWQGG